MPDDLAALNHPMGHKLWLRLVSDDGETHNFWAGSPQEMANALRGIIEGDTPGPKPAAGHQFPLESTRVEVFGERWGITKLPFPYLVSPNGQQRWPLFSTDIDLSRVSSDGYLVDRPWSEADEALGGDTDVAEEAADEAEAEAEPYSPPAEPASETEQAVADVSLAEPAGDDMFAGEPE